MKTEFQNVTTAWQVQEVYKLYKLNRKKGLTQDSEYNRLATRTSYFLEINTKNNKNLKNYYHFIIFFNLHPCVCVKIQYHTDG